MKFSFVFPTRQRVPNLKKTLYSIAKTTSDIRKVEILIAIDDDDKETAEYLAFVKKGILNIRSYTYPQKGSFSEYYNLLLPYVTGNVVWVWSDENILCTKKWDKIAEKLIHKSGFDIWYGNTLDFIIEGVDTVASGHPLSGKRFACFPMISKKACDALGFILTPRLRYWGLDLYMYMLFEKVNRIIPMDRIEIMSQKSDKPERMKAYHEDVKRLIDTRLAKTFDLRVPGDEGGVEYDLSADLRKLRDVIAIPRFYRLEEK